MASLFGAIFGLRCGGAASAWAVSFCSCYFWAVKASSANSLCVAVVIVRAVRAAVVIIGSCQSVLSTKRLLGSFKNSNRVSGNITSRSSGAADAARLTPALGEFEREPQ